MGTEYNCKVCRVLGERGLENYDERLLDQWRGDGARRKGYRQLATWVNVTLLRREMDERGLTTLGDEAESKYERLQREDASATEVENMLVREGIDVDRLRSDFVSYGVVRKHVTECLGAEYEKRDGSDWEQEAIDIARDRVREKISESVGSLVNKGNLETTTDLDVRLSVDLECQACQSRVPLQRALRRGLVCECDAPRPQNAE